MENGDEVSKKGGLQILYSIPKFALKSNSNALCRSGTIDEVANVALFLASSRASFLTGQILNADGGMGI
jgi:NAD(P)-dependent dehydrogenase (short-subunit alcohol dehydrogenase family)